MVSVVIWALLGVGVFVWNVYHPPNTDYYCGIRGTNELLGFPISGVWLCAALTVYCLVRYVVRKRRGDQAQGG